MLDLLVEDVVLIIINLLYPVPNQIPKCAHSENSHYGTSLSTRHRYSIPYRKDEPTVEEILNKCIHSDILHVALSCKRLYKIIFTHLWKRCPAKVLIHQLETSMMSQFQNKNSLSFVKLRKGLIGTDLRMEMDMVTKSLQDLFCCLLTTAIRFKIAQNFKELCKEIRIGSRVRIVLPILSSIMLPGEPGSAPVMSAPSFFGNSSGYRHYNYLMEDTQSSSEARHMILGTVRYISDKDDLIGIELDTPRGNSCGRLNSVSYFNCEEGFGIFVQKSNRQYLHAVSPVNDAEFPGSEELHELLLRLHVSYYSYFGNGSFFRDGESCYQMKMVFPEICQSVEFFCDSHSKKFNVKTSSWVSPNIYGLRNIDDLIPTLHVLKQSLLTRLDFTSLYMFLLSLSVTCGAEISSSFSVGSPPSSATEALFRTFNPPASSGFAPSAPSNFFSLYYNNVNNAVYQSMYSPTVSLSTPTHIYVSPLSTPTLSSIHAAQMGEQVPVDPRRKDSLSAGIEQYGSNQPMRRESFVASRRNSTVTPPSRETPKNISTVLNGAMCVIQKSICSDHTECTEEDNCHYNNVRLRQSLRLVHREHEVELSCIGIQFPSKQFRQQCETVDMMMRTMFSMPIATWDRLQSVCFQLLLYVQETMHRLKCIANINHKYDIVKESIFSDCLSSRAEDMRQDMFDLLKSSAFEVNFLKPHCWCSKITIYVVVKPKNPGVIPEDTFLEDPIVRYPMLKKRNFPGTEQDRNVEPDFKRTQRYSIAATNNNKTFHSYGKPIMIKCQFINNYCGTLSATNCKGEECLPSLSQWEAISKQLGFHFSGSQFYQLMHVITDEAMQISSFFDLSTNSMTELLGLNTNHILDTKRH